MEDRALTGPAGDRMFYSDKGKGDRYAYMFGLLRNLIRHRLGWAWHRLRNLMSRVSLKNLRNLRSPISLRNLRSPRSLRGLMRRRRRGTWIRLAGVSAVVALVVLVTVRRDPEPTDQLLIAEKYVNLARQTATEAEAPEAFESAARSLAEARSSMLRQYGLPAFLRNYGPTRERILEAQKLTAQAIEEGRQTVQDRGERLEQEIRAVRQEVAEVRALLLNLPPRYHRALRFVVSAESRISSAQRAHGPYETRDALASVQAARGEVTFALQNVRGLLLGFLDRKSEWNEDLNHTLAWTRNNGGTALVIDKLNHRAHIVRGGRSVRSYPAEFGPAWLDKKVVEGDRATPEGRYKIVRKKGPSQTRYHKALLLNYPNEEDAAAFNRMKRAGIVSRRARMGGLIEVHGDGGKGEDWTFGCVSLSNRHMDEVWNALSVGSPVTIVGIWEEPRWLSRLLQTASNRDQP